jgi:hypothetical protein
MPVYCWQQNSDIGWFFRMQFRVLDTWQYKFAYIGHNKCLLGVSYGNNTHRMVLFAGSSAMDKLAKENYFFPVEC